MKQGSPLSRFIFLSRWLQVPLYIGLIFAQGVYSYRFVLEVYDLIVHGVTHSENELMLIVLGLIDVVLVSNLLVMVVIGGFETFVSRMHLDSDPDRPEWLDHTNASTLKIKLGLSLISISANHLLETFINADRLTDRAMLWKVVIHVSLIISAVSMAWIDNLMHPSSDSTQG